VGVGVIGSFAFNVLVVSTVQRRLPDGLSSVRSIVSRKSKSSILAALADFEVLLSWTEWPLASKLVVE
jgi:hypothetical protein